MATLREVLLAWPGDELSFTGDPDQQLMLRAIDLGKIRQQASALAEIYRASGVVVHFHSASVRPPPNFIFMRDLFFMTPEGAVLGRMASEQRSGEERHAAEALAKLGVPLLMTPRADARLEGADALWLDSKTVLVGIGNRTNAAGHAQLAILLRSLGVETVTVTLSRDVQHLLGAVVLLDRDLAAVRRGSEGPEISSILEARGYRCVVFDDDDEMNERRAMNIVTLAPRRIVMPAGCPRARSRFEQAGVSCIECDVSEYIGAGGALGCLTGILRRDSGS
ncbi:MAG TPA: arginine deiminase family protein [Polyangiaceae bacterium]|nr:arginine deiminase family protein [Polyangiaceae bacterium]